MAGFPHTFCHPEPPGGFAVGVKDLALPAEILQSQKPSFRMTTDTTTRLRDDIMAGFSYTFCHPEPPGGFAMGVKDLAMPAEILQSPKPSFRMTTDATARLLDDIMAGFAHTFCHPEPPGGFAMGVKDLGMPAEILQSPKPSFRMTTDAKARLQFDNRRHSASSA
jgi:hypothetical protein